MRTLKPDADVRNADWTKRTWDLPTTVGWYVMRYGDDLADWLVRFIQLPAAEAMPETLRAALFAVAGIEDSFETKGIRRVRDAAYWGKPVGTPITPGMKPVAPHDETVTYDRGARYRADMHIPMAKDDVGGDSNKRFRIPAFEDFLPWGFDIPAVNAGYPSPDIDTTIDAETVDALASTGDDESPMHNPLNMAYERYGMGIYPDQMKRFVQFELARHMSAACDSDPELAAWVDAWEPDDDLRVRVNNEVTSRLSKDWASDTAADILSMTSPLGHIEAIGKNLNMPDEVVAHLISLRDQISGLSYDGLTPEEADALTARRIELQGIIAQYLYDSRERLLLAKMAFHGDYETGRYKDMTNRDLKLLALVDMHIKTWAGTSMDTDYTSISVQHAVEEEFGLVGHATVYDRVDADHIAAAKMRYEEYKPFLHAFVRSVYQNTQDFLASNNVETIYAMRGVKFNTDSDHFKAWYAEQPEYDAIEADVQTEIDRQKRESVAQQMADAETIKAEDPDYFAGKSDDDLRKEIEWLFDSAHQSDSPATQIIRRNLLVDELKKQGKVQQQPVSSWSVDINVAEEFARGEGVGLRLGAWIPASRIWSTSFTGLGCLGEKELLVLGGTDEVEITDMRRPRG